MTAERSALSLEKMCRIVSTIRGNLWFLCDRSPIRVKTSDNANRFAKMGDFQLRERSKSPAHAPRMGRGSGTVNRMTKCEFVILVTLLTLSTAILLLLSK